MPRGLHQSPEETQGPSAARTSPSSRPPSSRTGRSPSQATRTGHGGRNRRSVGPCAGCAGDWREGATASAGLCMMNASGRCVSAQTGVPTRSSPTMAARRARFSQNETGSRRPISKRPSCFSGGRAGAATRRTPATRASVRTPSRCELRTRSHPSTSAPGSGSRNSRRWSVSSSRSRVSESFSATKPAPRSSRAIRSAYLRSLKKRGSVDSTGGS